MGGLASRGSGCVELSAPGNGVTFCLELRNKFAGLMLCKNVRLSVVGATCAGDGFVADVAARSGSGVDRDTAT